MDISYLHGREVTGVLEGTDAHGYDGAVWAIELEAEGRILCFDESHEAPVLDGLAFTTSVVTDEDAKLYFGTDTNPTGTMVMLRPESYGVMDDLYSEGAVVRANAPEPEAAESPVAASETGTEADGPSDEFLASEAAREAAEEKRLADAQETDDDGA